MLRVLAVDDEEPLLEELLFLLRSDPRVRSAEGASDATGALRRITRALEAGPDGAEGIDVVFLDIHMAGLTGLDIARLLTGFARPPLIVFVTAHEGFAVQAFDLKAVDYVLKPVRPERLAEAVRRARAQLGRDGEPPAVGGVPPAAHAPNPNPYPYPPLAGPASARPGPGAGGADRAPEQIAVELGGVTRFVAIADITYVEAQGDYARLHTTEGSHLVRIPLSTLEERWAARGFVRIHRRHLVALGRIDELRLDAGTTTVRVGAAELQVSRRHARELRDLLVRRAAG
ncbi:LytR/AlgR family response regulator transcription factor [Streptomyces sp. NPDC051567]|uniref:LytR/AlgR family response regulator transcription factor n=1 Tax=Streptomyces sp. NPDC051567 TaxID=3365660 RepID=UPI0037A49C2B